MSDSPSDEEELEVEENSTRARILGLPQAMVARLTGFDDPRQKWRR